VATYHALYVAWPAYRFVPDRVCSDYRDARELNVTIRQRRYDLNCVTRQWLAIASVRDEYSDVYRVPGCVFLRAGNRCVANHWTQLLDYLRRRVRDRQIRNPIVAGTHCQYDFGLAAPGRGLLISPLVAGKACSERQSTKPRRLRHHGAARSHGCTSRCRIMPFVFVTNSW
jgi:hypothetical protein